MMDARSEANKSTSESVNNYAVNVQLPDEAVQPHVPLQSTLCYQVFNDNQNVMAPVVPHANIILYQCNICYSVFGSLDQLDLHKQQFHRLVTPESSVHPVTKRKRINMECDICGKVYTRKEILMRHKYVSHNFHNREKNIFSLTEKTFQNSAPEAREVVQHDGGKKRYECDRCDKSYSRLDKLRKHRITCVKHYYECDKCQKKFTFKDSLSVHQNIVHGTEGEAATAVASKPLFKCNICKMEFFTSCELGDHKKTEHSKSKPYDCVICYQSFSNQQYLARHIEMHTGQKPCICSQCGAIFLLPYFLEKHKMEEH